MDETPKYIKMCKEAWKDLKREIEFGDIVAYRYAYNGYISEGVNSYYSIADYWLIREANESEYDYIFIAWKQDQLQEIGWKKNGALHPIHLFDTFSYALNSEFRYYMQFVSPEQLWLAFVMSKSYFKEWNIKTEKWEKGE